MSITYTQLKAILPSYMEDSNPDYTANLGRVISQGELRVAKDLDLEIFNGGQNGSVATAFITVPALMISVHYLYVNGISLQPRSEAYLIDYAGTGQPLYYNVSSETQIRVAPVPASTLSYTLKYRRTPPALSNTVATTWLSDNVPEILLYACLLESEAYLKADERLQVWTSAYADAIKKFKDQHPELVQKRYP